MYGFKPYVPRDEQIVDFAITDKSSHRLHIAADARKITVAELTRRIVEAVAGDDMIDAVLDDGQGRNKGA